MWRHPRNRSNAPTNASFARRRGRCNACPTCIRTAPCLSGLFRPACHDSTYTFRALWHTGLRSFPHRPRTEGPRWTSCALSSSCSARSFSRVQRLPLKFWLFATSSASSNVRRGARGFGSAIAFSGPGCHGFVLVSVTACGGHYGSNGRDSRNALPSEYPRSISRLAYRSLKFMVPVTKQQARGFLGATTWSLGNGVGGGSNSHSTNG